MNRSRRNPDPLDPPDEPYGGWGSEREPEPEPLPTILRQYSDGETIALFPTVPGDQHGETCQSYMVVGQHGAADFGTVIDDTKPAEPRDCTDLLAELGRMGYRRLKFYERQTRELRERRRTNLETIL